MSARQRLPKRKGTAANFYRAISPIKRARRSRAEIDDIKSDIYAVLEADHPMTVRQIFTSS